MPIFERPPLDTLAPAKDRWTSIYLEYGRLEVDDFSVKWICSDGLVIRILIATVSALILGLGSVVTHAAGTLPFIYDAAALYKHETSCGRPSRCYPSIPKTTALS